MTENFTVFNLGNIIVNCWAYSVGEGYVIIDTGYESNYKNFKRKLKKRGISVGEIKYCFLTHAHDDHAGFLNNFLTDNPDVKIIMSGKGLATLRRGQNSFDGGCTGKLALAFCNLMKIFGKGQHSFPPIKREFEKRIITVFGDNGGELQNILNGKIIKTAGHTSDSVSLLLNNGFLFCGDAAMNGFPARRNITIWAEDKADFLLSWQKIIKLQPKKIFPGHGKPFDVCKLIKHIKFVEKIKLYPLK